MNPIVYVIDDDEAIRDSLAWLLESRGIPSRAWASAEAFLADRAAHPDQLAGCIVLDIRMDGMSGLELFDRLLEERCRLPVIFLTGHGDVPMAVGAIKKGAFDFFEKPFDDAALIKRVVSHATPKVIKTGAKAGQASQANYDLAPAVVDEVRARVKDLLKSYPLYPELDLDYLLSALPADEPVPAAS